MPVADTIGRILYAVSHALLVPIMVALIALMAGSIYLFGRFVGEAIGRARSPRVTAIASGEPGGTVIVRRSGIVARFMDSAALTAGSPARLRRAVRECEVEAARSLEGLQVISRLGPVLGLVGTLIPMGPALLSLATGDVNTIARNAVAFANTIVGLTSGGIAFVLLLVRRRWYAQDLSDVEFLYDVYTEGAADAIPSGN